MTNDPRAALIKKSLSDPKFRAELLKNPAAAVEAALGMKLPSGTTIRVVEDSTATVHLVLPAPSSAAKGALSEAELGKVAGGGAGQFTMPTYCTGQCSQGVCP